MTRNRGLTACLIMTLSALLTACGQDGAVDQSSAAVDSMHQELRLVDPALFGSSQSAGLVSSMAIASIGSVYLDGQLPAVTVDGVQLQASDISASGADTFVTYASVDTGGVIIKKGAVEHVKIKACTDPTKVCLAASTTLSFPGTDLFASYTDGTNLWVAGSTIDESVPNNYARLYRVTLDANKDPAAIAVTKALASYAGTSIAMAGSSLLLTTGTSTNAPMMGGLNVLDPTTLNLTASQPLYDARGVKVDPSDATKAFVVRGAISSSNQGAVDVFPSSGSATYTREIATGGNTIPKSHSSVQVGRSLVITSMGDQGLRVSCKATGASLATVAAPTVTGIPTAKTVTNSALAIPGYLMVANGEAGLYVYQFDKSSALNTSYCQGVTLTLLGRLSLSSSGTYVNGELSANSLTYAPFLNVANLVTSRMVMVASGNKGVSLLNMSSLTVSLTAVDDF